MNSVTEIPMLFKVLKDRCRDEGAKPEQIVERIELRLQEDQCRFYSEAVVSKVATCKNRGNNGQIIDRRGRRGEEIERTQACAWYDALSFLSERCGFFFIS